MIGTEEFKRFATLRSENSVSIYIPTHRAGNVQEDKIRFKNALNAVRNELESKGMEKEDAVKYLRKAFDLMDKTDFWLHLSDGLALFLNEEVFHYEISPLNFNTFHYVGDRFYVRPLIPLLTGDDRYFLLALSQNEVRFFEGHKYSIIPVKINDLVPKNMKEALALDQREKRVQMHSGDGGNDRAIYHGHGSGKDVQKKELRLYFKEINDGLMKMLYDEKAPMIIHAVDYLVPIYEEVNKYANLVEENVSGNPEHDDPVLLHEKSWAIMGDKFQEERDAQKELFQAKMAENEASFTVYDILPAAVEGKVQTLFLDKDKHIWGEYDLESNEIELHEERKENSICLLNEVAVKTFLKGGKVINVAQEDLPRPTASSNAIYRY